MNHWICTKEFADQTPLDIYCKEQAADNGRIPDIKNVHTLFRRQFVLDDPAQAVLRITADDYYELFINGQFVGQGPAAGYPFRYNVNTYDVAAFLQKGENVLAVHVFYSGYQNRVYTSGDLRMGLFAELTAGGETVVTDESWRCAINRQLFCRPTRCADITRRARTPRYAAASARLEYRRF